MVLFHDALKRQICKNRDWISFVEFNRIADSRGRRRGRRGSGRVVVVGRSARFSRVFSAVIAAMIKTFSPHRWSMSEVSMGESAGC